MSSREEQIRKIKRAAAKIKVNSGNLTDYIIRWESGNLSDGEVVALFQYLVDSGMAWSLQGAYGRQAMAFIEAGLVVRKAHGANYRSFRR